MKLWMKYNDIGGVNMPKKENPLRQLPVSSDGYGDIKIHLAEILEEKHFSQSVVFPHRNAENTIKKLQG